MINFSFVALGQGAAALVTDDRSGWLASNHVMRLTPHPGVRPGALWLAVSSSQAQAQIKALSFGSVVDQVNPGDVAEIYLPRVRDEVAREVERAWELFAEGAGLMRDAVWRMEDELLARSGQPQVAAA